MDGDHDKAVDKRKRDLAESDNEDSGDDGNDLSDGGSDGGGGSAHGGGAGASSKPLSKADKRAHHNALERKRRDHIKDSFSTLRDAVPALSGEKASRAQILNKATDYIQYMRKRNAAHQLEMEELKKQNGSLSLQGQSLQQQVNQQL